MRVEFVDPFVRAAFCALAALTENDPGRGPLSVRSLSGTTQQVSIVLNVSGDIFGKVLYAMSTVTAQKIAFSMASKPIEEMDETAWNSVKEFGGVMSGMALKGLLEAGFKCEIAPPALIREIGAEVSSDVPALVVPMSIRFGKIEIDIALSEQPVVTA